MRRYGRLLAVQFRASALLAMQYRADFLLRGALSVFWAMMAFVPLSIVFSEGRSSVAGWTFPESLVVLGWFLLLKSVLEGAINPSLLAVVEHIRKGTLDFVLLKPVDAQFLVSTARFEPWQFSDALAGMGIFAYAFHAMGRAPALGHVALSLGLLALAALVLYSLWIVVISAAFYVVRIDNLSHLFSSIFDAARWPISVFQGTLRLFFTFVIPLALMTTFPAMALLGKLRPGLALGSALGALVFAAVARVVWTASLSRYTSASS